MVERTNTEGSMRESSSGCPVQHAQENSQSAVGNGQPSSAQGKGSGVWSGVAAWLPFRGGGGSSGGDSATGGVTNSSDGGGDSVTTQVQSTALGTKKHGGCPENSSEGGDSPPSSSGCPVQDDSAAGTAATPVSKGLGSIWGYLTGCGGGGGDVSGASTPPAAPAAPPQYNERNNEYVYGNEVAAGQEMPLSTSRQRSSIPKAEFNPDHQPQVMEGWVRPTHRRLFGAENRFFR